MKTVKTGQLFIALIVIKLPIVFDCLSSNMSSFAATLSVGSAANFSVGVNGKALGKIELTVQEDFYRNQGLEGAFTPTGMTLTDIRRYLGSKEQDRKVPTHLNWLQVLTSSNLPLPSPQAPSIDPIIGGFSKQWADNLPWYFDEELRPDPLPVGKEYGGSQSGFGLQGNTIGDSLLQYSDFVKGHPIGTEFSFQTFLVADYGDKTYRPLDDGFQWSVKVEPRPLNPSLGVTKIQDPINKVTYNPSLFDSLVSAFGYTRRTTPLFSKTFSGTLASGSQRDTYQLDKLIPGSKYTAWTNNDLPSNRCNPNTYLSTSTTGSRSLYDDNSSPVGNGFASGLTGTVGNSGTLNLAVQAANGGARGQDQGNYELFVNVYEHGELPTFSNGNSGGGGVGQEMRGLTQQNPILPTSVQNGWQTFSQVPGCRWYDPYTTYGFEFQSLEDTLFTEILDFPVGDDTEFAVTVGNVLLGTFGPGSSVDFVSLLGHGVSNFKITDINSLFGSTAETAFPIQLAFNEREGSFKMRAISAEDAENVPEPTTVLGTLLAVGGLGTIKKLKNRKTKE
jgi:hypothetical protein